MCPILCAISTATIITSSQHKVCNTSSSVPPDPDVMKLFSARLSLRLLLFLLVGLLLAPHFQLMASASDFCDGKCKVRCSKAGVKDRCLKDCEICCEACKCVPSGTYGNKDECPCYRDKYTGEGKRRRPKCP